MTTFATLVVASPIANHLAAVMLNEYGFRETSITDHDSPAQRRKIARLSSLVPSLRAHSPPAVVWRRSSKSVVVSGDIEDHIRWVLRPEVEGLKKLGSLRSSGCSVYVDCYWVGPGNGGGPSIGPEVLALLVRQEVEVRFDFYSH